MQGLSFPKQEGHCKAMHIYSDWTAAMHDTLGLTGV